MYKNNFPYVDEKYINWEKCKLSIWFLVCTKLIEKKKLFFLRVIVRENESHGNIYIYIDTQHYSMCYDNGSLVNGKTMITWKRMLRPGRM